MVTRYNITRLYPSAHYQVQVMGVSPIGSGEPSSLINVSTDSGGTSCPLRECRVVCFVVQAACHVIAECLSVRVIIVQARWALVGP